MASEKFQQILWQVINGYPSVHNVHDDVRVVEENYQQLHERVENVVKMFDACGLTFNYDKCVFGVDHMLFMGDMLTIDGLQVSSDKVNAVVNAPKPYNKTELRGLLGLAQFCAKYVNHLATATGPLWDLTGKAIGVAME